MVLQNSYTPPQHPLRYCARQFGLYHWQSNKTGGKLLTHTNTHLIGFITRKTLIKTNQCLLMKRTDHINKTHKIYLEIP